jgi:hypothetical protein
LCWTTPRITRTQRNLDESPREAALVRDARLVKKAAPAEPPPPHQRFVVEMSVGQPTVQISIIKKVFYHD